MAQLTLSENRMNEKPESHTLEIDKIIPYRGKTITLYTNGKCAISSMIFPHLEKCKQMADRLIDGWKMIDTRS